MAAAKIHPFALQADDSAVGLQELPGPRALKSRRRGISHCAAKLPRRLPALERAGGRDTAEYFWAQGHPSPSIASRQKPGDGRGIICPHLGGRT